MATNASAPATAGTNSTSGVEAHPDVRFAVVMYGGVLLAIHDQRRCAGPLPGALGENLAVTNTINGIASPCMAGGAECVRGRDRRGGDPPIEPVHGVFRLDPARPHFVGQRVRVAPVRGDASASARLALDCRRVDNDDLLSGRDGHWRRGGCALDFGLQVDPSPSAGLAPSTAPGRAARRAPQPGRPLLSSVNSCCPCCSALCGAMSDARLEIASKRAARD
jgi:hypothetical protein